MLMELTLFSEHISCSNLAVYGGPNTMSLASGLTSAHLNVLIWYDQMLDT